MQVHFLGINSDQWNDWLERFTENLRERNNAEEIVAQPNGQIGQDGGAQNFQVLRNNEVEEGDRGDNRDQNII